MKITFYFDGLTEQSSTLSQYAALRKLLAIGRRSLTTQDMQTYLFQRLGFDHTQDAPIAVLTQHAEASPPEHAQFWLADPVHLTLQRDFFSLDAPAPLQLARDESAVLIDALNTHFAGDGLSFSLSDNGHWLLRSTQARQLTTHPLSQVVGRDTRAFSPQGADARWAASLMNEVQMLLFEHPVNQAREQRGEPPVNSLWLSCGGVLPNVMPALNATVYADAGFMQGLAIATRTTCAPLPDSVSIMLQKNSAEVLAWVNLNGSAHDWFAEVLQLLTAGKLKQVTLHLSIMNQMLVLTLNRWDVLKFWRRPLSILDYLGG